MAQDLEEATGMAGPMDMAAGEVVGMQRGVLGGGIPLIQLLTHTRLAHHLPYMCNRFWLSPLCWQHNPNPQSGIFAHPPRNIFRM